MMMKVYTVEQEQASGMLKGKEFLEMAEAFELCVGLCFMNSIFRTLKHCILSRKCNK